MEIVYFCGIRWNIFNVLNSIGQVKKNLENGQKNISKSSFFSVIGTTGIVFKFKLLYM